MPYHLRDYIFPLAKTLNFVAEHCHGFHGGAIAAELKSISSCSLAIYSAMMTRDFTKLFATMPTILETKQEQLEEVRAAISKILTHGQSYTIMDGGAQRILTRANLKVLQEREKQLEREVDRLTRGGIGVNYGMPK